jgi:hypothetical protein
MRSADSLPMSMTIREMIDLDRVVAHIDRAVKSGRYEGRMEPADYLLLSIAWWPLEPMSTRHWQVSYVLAATLYRAEYQSAALN